MERLRAKHALPSPSLRRAIRENAGASQADLAEVLGVQQRTVGRWEAGRNTPQGRHLVAYVELLAKLQEVSR